MDGFSLVNYGSFAKFIKLSLQQTFLLYGNSKEIFPAGFMVIKKEKGGGGGGGGIFIL